jgi:hypothetical protein
VHAQRPLQPDDRAFQRGQRPKNPRFKDDHKSRCLTTPAWRLQALLVGLMVSMT